MEEDKLAYDLQESELFDLLEFFSKNTYNAWDTHPKVHHVMQRCLDLFGLDYNYSVVSNSNGELSTNYPSSLIILEGDKNHEETEISTPNTTTTTTTTNGELDLSSLNISTPNGDSQNITNNNSSSTYEGFNPIQELPKIITKARYARCRARFPVPVILYNNKHICRSATLSGGPEIYGRTSFDYFFSGSSSSSSNSNNVTSTVTDSTILQNETPIVPGTTTATTTVTNAPAATIVEEDNIVDAEGQGDWQLFDRVRNQDIRLLKAFQVHTIVDLMVEKKKVKFGVNVTSSEKVDKKNRYANFKLISLPYPGCEFFKQYRDNGYSGLELMFEWNQSHVDACIFVPSDDTTAKLNLDWSQYRTWDLVCLTQNYLKLLLAYLKGENSGLLIHCISGWDRTPLFVSILRLSLWADGVIHKSLSAEQVLFLTLAYDWLLFGHNLEDRLGRGEVILHFCFYFLKHIIDDDFSIDYINPNLPNVSETLPNVQNIPDIPLSGPLETENSRPTSSKDFQQTVDCNGGSNSDLENHNGKDVEPPTTTYPVINNHDLILQDCNNGAPEINGISNGFPNEVPCSNAHSQVHDTISESDSPGTYCNNSQPINGVNGNINGNHQNGIISVPPHSERETNGNDCSETLDSTLRGAESTLLPDLNGSSSNGNVNGEEHQNDSTATKESNDENVIPLSIKDTKPSLPGSTTATADNEDSNGSLNPKPITRRSERLQLVRSHFYTLYNAAIGSPSQRNGGNENTGFSVIIDNIATKVGITRGNRVS